MDNLKLRNICIYGLGGVGGYFGGMIAYCNTLLKKYNVFFIARGQHLEAINRNGGLKLETDDRTFLCTPEAAADNLNSIPAPDLCLLCVKSYHLDTVLPDLESKLHDNTIILPLLNGVDIYERIRPQLSKGIVLPSCLYILSCITEPGKIRKSGEIEKIIAGPDQQNKAFNPLPLIHFFQEMKLNFTWEDDPFPSIWEKFVLVAATNIVNTAAGKNMGEALASPLLTQQLKTVMAEIIAIAEKKGTPLNSDLTDMILAKLRSFPTGARSSYQRDVEAGKLNEGDLFGGTIINYGKLLGVPTPLTKQLYRQILYK